MFDPLCLTPQEKLVLDNFLNGVCLIDKTKNIVYWNTAAERMLGYTQGEVINQICDNEIFTQDIHGDTLCNERCPLCFRGSFEPSTTITSLRHKDGYRLPMQVRCIPLWDHENNVIGAIKIFDVTYIREDIDLKLKELGQFAYLDVLTAIPNRRYLEETLQEWLQPNNRRDLNCAVAMGDIDFFKNVNDKHGHDAGDLVLKKVATTLRKNLRSADIVGRWGGEEFLILLYNVNRLQLSAKLESLRKAIEAGEVEYNGVFIKVTMSFGCTMPRKEDTPTTIVARADEFLYKSKREGRNRVSIAEE